MFSSFFLFFLKGDSGGGAGVGQGVGEVGELM